MGNAPCFQPSGRAGICQSMFSEDQESRIASEESEQLLADLARSG